MKLAHLLGGFVFSVCLLFCAAAKVNIDNADFETGSSHWTLFVPAESIDAGCNFSIEQTAAHSGQYAGRLTSSQSARFGVTDYDPKPTAVKAGHRYHLTVWIKAGTDFVIGPGTPGPVLRATLFDRQMKDVPGGHIFVGLSGVQRGDPTQLSPTVVPTEWTKLEGIAEIPEGACNMLLFVFAWKSSGTLWIDDVSVVEVDQAGQPLG